MSIIDVMFPGRVRVEHFKRTAERHGVPLALADSALSVINRFGYDKILKGVMIDTVDSAFMTCDARYAGGFIAADTLRELVTDPANQLTHDFLDRALDHGDECYGFFEGAQLASYGWYSRHPTEIEVPGLAVHFHPSYIYMYKGHTHPAHRGRRLHAIGMTRALAAYLDRGFKGIVSYIEWNNFDSLKSCYRMGYRDFGNLYVARVFGRYFCYADPGCRRFQFRLEKIPPHRAPRVA